MRLSQTRLLAATAVAGLALAVGAPLTADAASAATVHGSAAAAAAKAHPQGKISSKVTGTFHNKAGRGTFKGTFTPTKFKDAHGVLEATGVLKGKLTNAHGKTVGTVSRTITDKVDTPKGAAAKDAAADPAACSNILNLNLGPLNLNLLGLVVHLNDVHLTITAVPGAGNLLGNLLCAITGLLNGGGSLSEIATDLNSVLALL